ncbi:hypothetical protein KBY93_02315 [Synechococcus sp. J7-Johnson]|uniref:YcgJ family protein n=1 Tax=Synechococcus sp. J7-Johnson TaxID=2823737 RepID=UPI0020CF4257|nr:YcgJ family protein [Synechococcus sp. J7-Johnson]MCP9839467.1 hypothetical protein [Synechococcus sp. J7-Johnson]
MTTNFLIPSRPAHASLALAAGWLALLTTVVPQPGWTQSNSLKLTGNGVVCDRGSRICYDRQGPSLTMTRREFGQRSEQNLRRQISGRPNTWDVRFSSGEACDLRRQICWDDGRSRTNISKRLSRQLFGDNGDWARANGKGNNGWENNGRGKNGWGNNNWGNNSWGQPTALDSGFCELNQRGRRIFSGNCGLQQRSTSNGTAYLVNLGNGREYSFYDQRGQLIMVDGNGTWPVAYSRRGNGGEFRWGDLQLVARQDRALEPRYGTGTSNSVLQDLINSLFR